MLTRKTLLTGILTATVFTVVETDVVFVFSTTTVPTTINTVVIETGVVVDVYNFSNNKYNCFYSSRNSC